MADTELDDESTPPPEAGPMLERAGVDWLEPLRTRIAAQQQQERLPHGFLLAGAPGAGQAEVGVWLAARLLCRGDASRPCGRCPDCRLFLAGSHPDYRWIGVLKDKKEISIDQMR
ncbi:MAG TPA: hypothetical protein VIG03_01430, partial [Steroidobacteraceae bacterium]